MTLEEIEPEISTLQARLVELRAEALRIPEMHKMPGAWVHAWLESHGATPPQATREVVAALNAHREANGAPHVGECSPGRGW